jgi:hypothetical protein
MKRFNLKFSIVALAGIVLAGCTSDNFTGSIPVTTPPEEEVPIALGSLAKAITRASHEESAALLNNRFCVYGSKTSDGVTSPIFDNYLVEYTANSAVNNPTSTNVKDWEYVGLTSLKGAVQGVKYWDFSAQQYDFVAAAGLAADELIINSDTMRFEVTDAQSMTSIFVSDRVTATPTAKTATGTTPATTAYKETVQFQFRRMGAQMRIGFYETVPGYAIKDLVFYYIGAPSGSHEAGVGAAFPQSGKYTVTYDDATNAATTEFVGAANKLAFSNSFGLLDYTSARTQEGVTDKPYLDTKGKASATEVKAFLGTSSSQATYGKGTYTIDGKPDQTSYYKPILPNEDNTLQMQLRVDYTLIALDGSGDSIHVRDAYVAVPASFLKWKPNYSYTYLFKISDNSNGYTGKGGVGVFTTGPGRDPEPNYGGDNDPVIDPNTGEVIPPYIPSPNPPSGIDPLIPDPDNPDGPLIPNPKVPLVPNPLYPGGPKGDQHDPSNPVPTPEIPDPGNPGQTIPDPENPAYLFPITFDAVVVEAEEGNQTVYTNVDGTNNSSTEEH